MKDYSLKINGQNYNVQIDEVNEASTVAHVTVNGTPYEVEIAGASVAAASRPQVAPAPREAGAAITPASTGSAAKPAAAPAASAGGTVVKCPLPGTVLAVKVAVGDTVAP
ncbi:MAG: acetyl-CoA carboxylase biotin carboxyl carrier protein subunit, partial [Alistipes sp.]|nr:acetyl-CoA carboxylase biotin carboxyl carrier protein subunit [Alistipes sp.]